MTVSDCWSSYEVVDRCEELCLTTKSMICVGRLSGENKFWDEWNSLEFETCLGIQKRFYVDLEENTLTMAKEKKPRKILMDSVKDDVQKRSK